MATLTCTRSEASHNLSDEVFCCSHHRRLSGSSRNWPRSQSKTGPYLNGFASGQTIRSGEQTSFPEEEKSLLMQDPLTPTHLFALCLSQRHQLRCQRICQTLASQHETWTLCSNHLDADISHVNSLKKSAAKFFDCQVQPCIKLCSFFLKVLLPEHSIFTF